MNDSPVPDSLLAGWRVRCEFPLPELLPWSGDDRAADLLIRTGEVPERLDGVVSDGPLLQVARDGSCRFAIQDVAAYFISPRGDEVIVAPASGPVSTSVRLFLLGSVFGILCHKRGLLPLHASCVAVEGRAIAFAGPSGAGKSTLAGAFVKAGYRLLTDDVTVVDVTAPGGPVVVPAFPRLKLWRLAMGALGLERENIETPRVEAEKYDVPVENAFATERVPLTAVYHLQRAKGAKPESMNRLTAGRAVRDTTEAIYRVRAGRNLVGQQALFRSISRLCSTVPCHLLTQKMDFERLDTRVAGLVARHASG